MTWPRLVGLLLLVALLPSGVSVLVLHGRSDSLFPDQAAVNDRAITSGLTLLIVAAAVTLLRWWPDVLHERLRTRAWVWVVPALLTGTAIALLDYSRAGSAGASITGMLLLAVACIAIGEELLFRGIVLVFLRSRTREVWAAIGSCLIFGLMHFPAGPVQVVISMVFGYLLYLTRRVSGGLLVPILIHAAWDFSVFTTFLTTQPGEGSNASVALTLLSVALVLVTAIGWKWVEPKTVAPA